ncbi:MAG: hypothetical protein B1H11_03075 [Desulfobacteraceae bacterium 4484_190.1]|nr:MAG: hypothetical protein B1H11_03075 [Desulfobacteraceae bacterium 4484_190.1]
MRKKLRANISYGFTLLEVMIAMTIIAIALTAIMGSQSQSVTIANEVKFNTTAPLLAQTKIAEIEIKEPDEPVSDSGSFGEDFPCYSWKLSVKEASLQCPEAVSDHLRQIDLTVSCGLGENYRYSIRLYQFH